jgi:AbrB family looped-hinge helix DNA binding protein
MRTTIDKAGRVVIPATLRERLGLVPGTALEVVVEDLDIRLVRSVPPPKLERRGQRLVVRSSVSENERVRIDVAALLDEERDRWPV